MLNKLFNEFLFIFFGDFWIKILFLTDLYYSAKGREYFKEDSFLSNILKEHFDLVLCHPKNSRSFEDDVDLIFF